MFESQEIIKIEIKTLLEDYDIKIPDCQRILDNDKLNNIIEFQKELFIKYGEFKFLGVISVVNLNDNYFLIDGQHRFNAMKMIYNSSDGKNNFSVYVQMIYVQCIEDLKSVYNNINENTPLPDIIFENKLEKDIICDTLHYFQNKYPNLLLSKNKVSRPQISFNTFQEILNYIQHYLQLSNSEDLIKIIEDYNNNHKNYKRNNYDDKTISFNMIEKAQKIGFYLGLYKIDKNKDYYYEWCKKIIEYQRPNIKIIINNKITSALRSNVWNTYIGQDKVNSKCVICDYNSIRMDNFEVGHIRPKSKGGSNKIQNLIPICGQCNKRMNVQHMDKFVEENYNQNLDNYYQLKNKLIT